MSYTEDEELKQLSFDFKPHVYMGREDFIVTSCNRNAFQMIEALPEWLSRGLVVYGPQGCGKSHLAHLFADRVKTLHSRPVRVSFVSAGRVNMRNVRRLAEENQSIVIENLTPKANMEALFHLFNFYNTEGRYMLWTAETAPARMNFALKDLQSRLNMLPSVEIKEPDDNMLQTLIVKLFNDRQILITPEVLQYIVNNAHRSFKYIEELVDEIDKISLAFQCAVSYSVVRKAIEALERRDAEEPDLFGAF